MYNDKVLEIFANPKHIGIMEDASAEGIVGNASCGDIMKVFLKIENDVIVNASFQTFGCTAAIASTDTAMGMIIGKTLDEALAITNADVVEQLEGLPPQKIHCSVMAEEAVREAIANYRGAQKAE